MTTTRHTALPFGGPLTSAAMESPLSQLDTAIVAVETALTAETVRATAQENLLLASAGFGGGSPNLDGGLAGTTYGGIAALDTGGA